MREQEFLQNLGFTQGESKVYLALLESGEGTTGDIVKKAKVSRSKVYEMLEKLAQRGLVSFVIKNKVKHYSASSPLEIGRLIKSRKKDIEIQEIEYEKIKDSLIHLLAGKKEQQTSAIYESVAGIKTLYNLVLSEMKKGEEYYAVAIEPESFSEEFAVFIENYHKKREEKEVKVKLLASYEIKNRLKDSLEKQKLIKIKYFSSTTPTSMLIFKDKVAQFVWGENSFAVLISSSTIASRYKTFFEYLWKFAKR